MKENESIHISAFLYFGLLPEICIHSLDDDEYSKMYFPRKNCDCGSEEWVEKGCTMIIGYVGIMPLIKNVHRCKKCNEVRLADHIGVK